MNPNQNSILLLDDDPNFRSHMSALLHSRGLNVLEARTGREANEIIATVKPILAIVDYRLPEQDGVSWISKVRADGRTFPIVFLSATWCDAKTFSRLRNLLKVSLILQKPIVADLFMQQIENLLPPNLLLTAAKVAELDFEKQEKQEEQKKQALAEIENQTTSSNSSTSPAFIPFGEIGKSSYLAVPSEYPPKTKAAFGNDTAAGASGGDAFNALTNLRSKLEREQKIEAAKAVYKSELHKYWSELVNAIHTAKENLADGTIVAEATNIAHKLHGTAGSVGFQSIGQIAGRIEDMIQHLDATDPLQEVIWPEIFRLLAEGELQVRKLQTSELSKDGGANGRARKKIMVWGSPARFESLTKFDELQIDVLESLPEVLDRLKRANYTAVFIDLSIGEPGEMFTGAKEIRMLHPGSQACIPLGCLLPTAAVPPEELVFAGFSVVLQHTATPSEIEWACRQLSSKQPANSLRVLTVDDDAVLTDFIANILSSEGMTIEALNNPIAILEALEEFKPDLVLLDVMMPGLSGYDVCRMLRSDARWKHLPIVFLTSKSDQAGRAAAFQAGGDDFLSKPILAEELFTRVRAQFDRVKREESEGSDQSPGTLRGREFMKEATTALNRSQTEQAKITMCLLAVDRFSEIIINHGMEAAARSMAALTGLCNDHFQVDIIRGRIGEEGLALMFPGEEQRTVLLALDKLLAEYQQISIPSDVAGHAFTCSFSSGVSQCPEDGATVHKLLSTANQRMLIGRGSGNSSGQ